MLVVKRSASTIKSPAGRVVVLGSGCGAYKTLLGLNAKQYDVVCVSPRNHFVFTPLLASTAVGTLEFRAITEPIRTKTNTYYSAFCNSMNFERKEISCTEALDGRSKTFTTSYDHLVIAVGAHSNTFNIPGVKEHAMFLKEINHARAIRRRILECFEFASEPNVSATEQADRLHFCIVVGNRL